MFDKLKAYKVYSNDVIFFKYIMDESDLSESNKPASSDTDGNEITSKLGGATTATSSNLTNLNDEFRPEFTHQIFGDEETIFGYKNLKINYYLTPGLLDAYIGFKYTDKISPRKFDGLDPDDIYSQFVEFGCSPGFTRNLDTFCSEKITQDRQFRPFGEKIHEYRKNVNQSHKFKDITNGNGEDLNTMSTFEVYRVDSSMDEFESQKFRDYLVRVQTMLVFFIETANFIDEEDPKWVHYFLYEKRKTSTSDYRYLTAGYLSVYHFYAYPDKTRSRVSQVLIMPPFQRAGHGAELLESVYRDAAVNSEIVDVTAEGPSAEFIQIRDYVTTKLCSSLSTFRDLGKLGQGLSPNMIAEALKVYKIPKLQSRRAYEIIRLANTNEHDPKSWDAFSAEIKQRFYTTFLKMSKFARASKTLAGENQEQEQPATSSSSSSKNSKSPESKNFNFKKAPINKLTSLSARFGAMAESNPFAKASELEPSTTSKSVSFGSINGNGVGKKTVTFGNIKNASYSSEDDGEDGDEDDDDGNTNTEIDFNKLLVSEPDRRQYIEQQFEDAMKEYRKVTQRLEACRILPF